MSYTLSPETVFGEVDLFLHGQRCGHCQTEVSMWCIAADECSPSTAVNS